LLEPLSLLLLGGLCGALIWALYLPVFEIGQVVT
jgi:type II secretory pathway component PulF